MTAAFQATAFQNNAFQVGGGQNVIPPPGGSINADLGGNTNQIIGTYLGPSLGWINKLIKPLDFVTVAGVWQIIYTNVVLINAAGLVTILLPDVVKWMQELSYQPPTGFEGAIWVKDLGGNANAFNITVVPFSGQKIDGQTQFTLINNRQIVRLYPLNDLSGWYAG